MPISMTLTTIISDAIRSLLRPNLLLWICNSEMDLNSTSVMLLKLLPLNLLLSQKIRIQSRKVARMMSQHVVQQAKMSLSRRLLLTTAQPNLKRSRLENHSKRVFRIALRLLFLAHTFHSSHLQLLVSNF